MDPVDGLLLAPAVIEDLYQKYRRDPTSVSADWAARFAALDRAEAARDTTSGRGPRFLTRSGEVPEGIPRDALSPGIQIYSLVHTFREFGHQAADLDPLGRSPRSHPWLDLEQFHFSQGDLDQVLRCETFRGLPEASLREYIEALRETYCGPIGIEYIEVIEKAERDWIQETIEPTRNRPRLTEESKRTVLRELIRADGFEENLQRMYPGAKRFSLEGGTTLVTLLQTLVEDTARSNVRDLVLGMAHRGRLNVLANVLQKPLKYILAEFESRPLSSELQGYGDVKYHLGYSHDYVTADGKGGVHLSLAFNPSHLEAVNPVVEGIVRAKQDYLGDTERRRVVPVLIHGDAAFVGQGIVAETFTLSGLQGYKTGGTIHVIVNNQVGFTADPEETRSTPYSSDLARSIRAPVLHVNADHPEAVIKCARLALGYRQKFGKDIVIDLVCFRRHGHNEQDDASFTQPVMAKLISEHASASEIYGRKLTLAGVVDQPLIDSYRDEIRADMRQAREEGREMSEQVTQRFGGRWRGLHAARGGWSADTTVEETTLRSIGEVFTRVPLGFEWHKRLQTMMQRRAESVAEGKALDWGTAEALAFGSLLVEGTPVRLSGQDSGRGTFGHRHAVYRDLQSGRRYVPLNHIRDDQAALDVINSPLSEAAVLGFEYGYSSADPWTLTLWEAQFGDFANGAQVIIDQLIASAEFKWGRMSGLVMLLPHGLEGQGPEHSSARLGRFLELCAENNLQVANLTTPAQLFHALRRQIHRKFRKPLIVMSPKSLLRHPLATSTLSELSSGTFHTVIDDPEVDKERVERALLCSGKVYYDLLQGRRDREIDDVAILRIEQLYPYPLSEVQAILRSYPRLNRVIWCQEEPRNMGAYRNLLHRFVSSCPEGIELDYIGRDSRAVPATGVLGVHRTEQEGIVEASFRSAGADQVVKRRPKRRTAASSG